MEPFTIAFSNGAIALAARVASEIDLAPLLQQMNLARQRPVLVVVGGAGKLNAADSERVRSLFVQVLAPMAQKWAATVIDGGTDTGVMRLMGQARQAIEGTFPLIGVIPADLAIFPDQAITSSEAAPLEPNHTHFLLVPGSTWGNESAWIADVASLLSEAEDSLTFLINGGEVAWQDASESVRADRSLIVVAGSGRTADVLAAALDGHLGDDRAREIVSSGLVQAIDLDDEAERIARIIEDIFTPGDLPRFSQNN